MRREPLVHEEYYHVYNRGANKAPIFLDDSDYKRFILLLYIANSTIPVHLSSLVHKDKPISFLFARKDTLVDIGAYCLMPNHFHLLIYEKSDKGITKFIRKLSVGYSMYFNLKHNHSGTVFQGRFQTKHACNDRYLKYLFAYIHLNPVELIDKDWKQFGINNIETARNFLNKYQYSSYPDYSNNSRPEKAILNRKAFPEYFKSGIDFEKEIIG